MKKTGFTLAEVIISLTISLILVIMISSIFVEKKKSNNPFLSKSGTFVCYKDMNADGTVVLRQATLIGGIYKNNIVSKCIIEFPANTNSYAITVVGAGGGGAGGRTAIVKNNIAYADACTYKFPATRSKGGDTENTISMPNAKCGPIGKIDFENYVLNNVVYTINGAGGGTSGKMMNSSYNNFNSFAIGGRGYSYSWSGNLKVGDIIKSVIGESGNSSGEATTANSSLGLHNKLMPIEGKYTAKNMGERATKYYTTFKAGGLGDDSEETKKYIGGYHGMKYGKGAKTTFTVSRPNKSGLKIVSNGGDGAVYNGASWRYQYTSGSVDKVGPTEGKGTEIYSNKSTDGRTYVGKWSWYNCPSLRNVTIGNSASMLSILNGKHCSVDGTNATKSTGNTTGGVGGTINDLGAKGGASKMFYNIYDKNNVRKTQKKYSNTSEPAEDGSVTVEPVSKTFQFFKNSIETYQTNGGNSGAVTKSQVRTITNNKIEITPSLIGNPGVGGNAGADGGNGGATCFSLTNNGANCLIQSSGGIGGSASKATMIKYEQNNAGSIVSSSGETFAPGPIVIIGKSGACTSCLNNESGGTKKENLNGGNALYGTFIDKDTLSNDGIYGRGGGSGANYFEFTKLLYSLSINNGIKMLCSAAGNSASASQLCKASGLSQGAIKAGQQTGKGGKGSGGAIIIKW